eukprot:scaffold322830_cov28-Tisochrysis_lutea.AAC.1
MDTPLSLSPKRSRQDVPSSQAATCHVAGAGGQATTPNRRHWRRIERHLMRRSHPSRPLPLLARSED